GDHRPLGKGRRGSRAVSRSTAADRACLEPGSLVSGERDKSRFQGVSVMPDYTELAYALAGYPKPGGYGARRTPDYSELQPGLDIGPIQTTSQDISRLAQALTEKTAIHRPGQESKGIALANALAAPDREKRLLLRWVPPRTLPDM